MKNKPFSVLMGIALIATMASCAPAYVGVGTGYGCGPYRGPGYGYYALGPYYGYRRPPVYAAPPRVYANRPRFYRSPNYSYRNVPRSYNSGRRR